MSAPDINKTLIAFSTAWGPQFGGINAFNHDLLLAIAAGFYSEVRVACVVPNATPEEVSRAQQGNVQLISLGIAGAEQLGPELEALAWNALSHALPSVVLTANTVWLGHDRITVAIALKARIRGGKAALVHHMSYDRYEHFAENSATAQAKKLEQTQLFRAADIILAVGPLLKDALEDLTERADARCVIPGLAEINPRSMPPNAFKVFLSGRLSEDAQRVKQAHLGLAGFAYAVAQCDRDTAYPNALKGASEPQMQLRGVDFEKTSVRDPVQAEAEIRAFVETHAGRQLNLSLLPFTHDRRALFDDLRSASAALMPSWHEGFGLVAWEAIAAGVPLVLSKKTGVYRLLNQVDHGALLALVLPIDPQGSSAAPFFSSADRDCVAQAVIQIAKAPDEWRRKAAHLRERLLQDFTWARCAETFVNALGWNLTLPAPQAVVAAPASTSQRPAPRPTLLELPVRRWQPGQGLALSQLLRAEEAIVPFDAARLPYLDLQLAWACSDSPPLSIRLLTGPGGTGKTRLALELCGRLAIDGWQAGLLPGNASEHQIRDIAAQLAALSRSGTASCVVLDYAETRQDQLLTMLACLLEAPDRQAPIRLLLLARSGGEWWAQLPAKRQACESLLLGEATTGPYELPPLHANPTERAAAYRAALSSFAALLICPEPPGTPDLDAPHFDNPLYLQMAALMALRGETPKTTEALTRSLIAHERRYWQQAVNGQSPEAVGACVSLMMLATLSGGFATLKEVERPWQAAALPHTALRTVWPILQPLYPGVQGLQGLRPDLLGESLVALTLLGAQGAEILHALLGSGITAWRRNLLTVLARILRAREDVSPVVQAALKTHFVSCAQELCEVAIATPSPLTALAIHCFQSLPPGPQAQVAGLLTPWLKIDILPLAKLGVAVFQSECARFETRHARKKTVDSSQSLAEAHTMLSVAHQRNGHLKFALANSERALTLYESLARDHPGRFEPGWAGCLSNHANFLADSGRHDEALAVSHQALGLRERLARDEPERFEHYWASSMNNQAVLLGDIGRHDEALSISEKALNLRERLARTQPERFEPNWAVSLSNHANILGDTGRDDEALSLSLQALNLHERLARNQPERFDPDWAMSLNNHANRLADTGRPDEALSLSQQALNLYERLARHQPERFEPDLAGSLNNHASRLADTGRYDEAMSISQQALELHERLARQQPERFETDFASSLSNHAVRLADMGRHDEALLISQQALDLRERLARHQPERLEPDWAGSLHNHAWRHADVGNIEFAYSAATQAQAISKRLLGESPRVHCETYWLASWVTRFLERLERKPASVSVCESDLGNLPRRVGRERLFAESALHLLAQIDANAPSLELAAIACAQSWSSLDHVQQRDWEQVLLVLSAVLQVRSLPLLEPEWMDRWKAFSKRRQGRIPVWMARAAKRFGGLWSSETAL